MLEGHYRRRFYDLLIELKLLEEGFHGRTVRKGNAKLSRCTYGCRSEQDPPWLGFCEKGTGLEAELRTRVSNFNLADQYRMFTECTIRATASRAHTDHRQKSGAPV